MKYVCGINFFANINEKLKNYPYLNKNIDCDILIIGGGINGAIANYFLSKEYDVVLVDKSRIGCCCTSMATALLEYQLDEYSFDLKSLDEEKIKKCYNLGLKSIKKLQKFMKLHGNYCNFSKRPSLIYSNKKKDKKDLYEEYLFRKSHGFPCYFIDENNNPFNFYVSAGIFCKNGGAELDPYLFTKQLIENSKNQENIFENTEILDIKKENNKFFCKTTFGEQIICNHVIVATGFDFKFVKHSDLCERTTSYTIVTNPLTDLVWKDRTLIQDVISPYHYMRLLPDDRIIFGGQDTNMKKEIDTKKAEKMYQKLFKTLVEMFPDYADEIQIDYKFCGAFASTENNIGLIGKDEDGIINFISCGANGITNAMIGIEVIQDILKNKPNPYLDIFSPLRKK